MDWNRRYSLARIYFQLFNSGRRTDIRLPSDQKAHHQDSAAIKNRWSLNVSLRHRIRHQIEAQTALLACCPSQQESDTKICEETARRILDTAFSPIDDHNQDKYLESKMCAKWCRSLECNPNDLRSSACTYRPGNKFLAVVP